ncbi:GABA permease [Aspergillus pseudoustus]|uniref:GABA permease n=1 Tax=Aspergillus pseudoustus TaxID=1810923 RepID=A0ABR4IKQ6_9EURO
MLATCVSLMATWEAICSTMTAGLISGGPVSLVYGFIWTIATALSLSECASMCPTTGGQYHYVALLSPRKLSAPFSYTAGWITVFGWQAVAGSAPFLAGTMIQGLLVLNNPGYVYERWHGTLLYWAVLAVALVINTMAIKLLPAIEVTMMILHVGLYVVLLIAMLVLAPTKGSASFVFTTFTNSSGWENDGVAWCIGMLSAAYVMVGYDGAAHLSTTMHNPSTSVPRAMIGSVLINAMIGLTFLITILFCIQDLDTALSTPTGFPIIEIFFQITQNRAGATALTSTVILMAFGATIPLVTSAAWTLQAFAADSGIPFSNLIARKRAKDDVPIVAMILTVSFLALLGLLNIASTTAFNAVLSLATVGLYTSYLLPTFLMLYRRIYDNESLPYGPFKLGAAGIPVNIISVIYTTVTSVFLLFPPYQPVTAVNFNYSSVILGAVLVFCAVYWIFGGRKAYHGLKVEILGVNVGNWNDA